MIDFKKASLLALLGTALAPVAFTAGAFADDAPHDVVKDTRGNIVHSSNGNCVITMWNSATDECNPQPKAEAPVVKREVRARLSKEERTVYFDFNKSTLNASEKAKLDQVSRIIHESQQVESVDIVGYADPIGTQSYNKKLSEKRAQTVKAYLAARGLKTHNVRMEGLGESNIATNCPKPAKGKKASKKEISCLSEDRRVEVQLNVTK